MGEEGEEMKDTIELEVRRLREQVIALGTAIDKVIRRHDDEIESLRRQVTLTIILDLLFFVALFVVMGAKG